MIKIVFRSFYSSYIEPIIKNRIMIEYVYIVWNVLAITYKDYYIEESITYVRMANICNNGLICYWADTAAFSRLLSFLCRN